MCVCVCVGDSFSVQLGVIDTRNVFYQYQLVKYCCFVEGTLMAPMHPSVWECVGERSKALCSLSQCFFEASSSIFGCFYLSKTGPYQDGAAKGFLKPDWTEICIEIGLIYIHMFMGLFSV